MASESRKGILGVKKDPKAPVLFMFKGGDDWPSSDDEHDQDYAPGIKTPNENKNCAFKKQQQSDDSAGEANSPTTNALEVNHDAKTSEDIIPSSSTDENTCDSKSEEKCKNGTCSCTLCWFAINERLKTLEESVKEPVTTKAPRRRKKNAGKCKTQNSKSKRCKVRLNEKPSDPSYHSQVLSEPTKLLLKKVNKSTVKKNFKELPTDWDCEGDVPEDQSPWGCSVPLEILSLIFHHVVLSSGAIPSLIR